MKLRQEVALRQQLGLRLNQELARAIGFLELSNIDLAQSLREIAQDNPWLRLQMPRGGIEGAPETAADGPTLIEHVLTCIPGLVARPEDRRIAVALTEALDQTGFLTETVEQVALRLDQPPSRFESVLAALQQIEPRGLFARSLSECLALQLAAEGPVPPALRRVLEALPSLTEGGASALARATGLPLPEVQQALATLRDLDPRPAAAFATAPTRIRVADLIFEPVGEAWHVRLNPETLPILSLHDLGATPARGSILSQARVAARALVRALDRRNRALLAVGEVLAQEQAEFLSRGPIALRALTMRAVAERVGLHESSVSRLINSASANTPRGTLALRKFFARSVRRHPESPSNSGPAVQARLTELIAKEDPRKPLSDEALARQLGAEGITASRRVVANWRVKAGIANRSKRRCRQ
ncbi:hypothetical protein LZA78_06165 [Sinirhodobacter sp. WL0062]|uniref:RNA polymerase sigma-54 factor n=1 Tax=Rhodobacter flavimaris TaxID=2907145 RepID=A0ABS8YUY7_9RHOB|nr:hypothetical protein [Sinirhodobacter sp. WL0062]MCE5973060.1 hypothetical protein [Sinirhodobacter sp. WL0062]